MMKRLMATLMTVVMIIMAAATAGLAEADVSEDLLDMMTQGAYRPADVGVPAQPEYEYAYMGLRMALPEALLNGIENKDIYMNEVWGDRSAEGEMVYGRVCWSAMTEEQKNAELSLTDDDFGSWLNALRPLGTIGAYHSSVADEIDELSGCTEHVSLGESADGRYLYYLSLSDQADEAEKALLKEITVTYTDIAPYPDFCGGFIGEELGGMDWQDVANVGEFSTQDVNGSAADQSIFSDKKLTLVNVMATWCSPCVNEIPALEKLRQELEAQGLGVVAFVMDTRNADGTLNQEAADMAMLLAERTGAQFPMLVPDETLLNGKLQNISAYPTSFFVDADGNIIGDMFAGAQSFEDWKSMAENQLALLAGDAQ